MARYRFNADGSVVCPHRDLSCCPQCLASDPDLMDVIGAVYIVTDPGERLLIESIIIPNSNPGGSAS